MKSLFRSKFVLIFTYILMLAVCVYLNLTAESLDRTNMLISGVMFAIVLILFIFAFVHFAAVDSMIRDLDNATAQIKDDFRSKKGYLWEGYRSKENLFRNKTLNRRYKEFSAEVDRLGQLSDGVYKSDIEDYINQELLDDTISRNVLNLVSGTMTGLGILGTFIGLSIGLQAFNTGSAQEITDSIAPLIQGIKVAFHTSIYGMVFALVFSFVFKGKLDQASDALDRFLDAYDNYVLPDSKNENLSQMLAFQKKQAEGMTELATALGEKLGVQLREVMNPQFDRMNATITSFAEVATRAQIEGVEALVDKFVAELNRQLSGAFSELGRSMTEMVEWQKENRTYMRSILEEVGGLTTDLSSMAALSQRSVEQMAAYMNRLDELQQMISSGVREMQSQMETSGALSARQQEYIAELVAYEKQLSESAESFSTKMAEQLAFLQRMESKLTDISKRHIDEVTQTAVDAHERVAQTAEAAGDTLIKSAQFSADTVAQAAQAQMEQMLKVSGSMNTEMKDAAVDLRKAETELGTQLANSLRTTYQTIDQMQEELKTMVHSMDVLRRSTAALEKLGR